eukprot:TRINITY_DN11209_c0_g2_i1.p1 TRINITY_DN11209_c0_g2~~TRINITY_DN11209_c0_g2_i1.p1  ORF type:complete len:1063 (+),score=139.00 TRINITY_DN11209_c0_g2_i1:139-3189(+)
MPPAAGGRAAALGLLLCACDGAAAQPDFTNCQEPVNMFNMGSGLQSSPCAVNTDAVEPAPGGGYLFTCWDSPVMLCDSDGGGPRPANCRAVGLLGCGGLYDLAFSAAGDALYAACGGEVRRCDWDAVTATPSGCAAVTGAVCPFDGMETGVALDGSTLVLGCYSSNKASDAGVLLCTLQAGGAAVQGSCTKRGEVPCGSATGQTMFRNVGLSLDSAGGAALGCRQDGSVYCSSFSVSSGPSGCSEPTPTSPCPSNTMGFTLLRSGQTAVSCDGDGLRLCGNRLPSVSPTTAPSVRPSARPTAGPTTAPSARPSPAPSVRPSASPSQRPSRVPSAVPSNPPSDGPTRLPTGAPTLPPSGPPSPSPSQPPSVSPSTPPSLQPSLQPSRQPSLLPTAPPSAGPASASPTASPTTSPTAPPSSAPSTGPSASPSGAPSTGPSASPSGAPSSSAPSTVPSRVPSGAPSPLPTVLPTTSPILQPFAPPSGSPHTRTRPSKSPQWRPSSAPSGLPLALPSTVPSFHHDVPPSSHPSTPASALLRRPSRAPSDAPSLLPTAASTASPSQGMPRARQEAGDRVEVLVPANTAAVAAGVIAKVPVAIGAGAGLKGIMAMPGGGVVGAGGNGRATARMAAIVALLECPGEPTDVGMLASPTQLSLGSGDLAKLRGCVLGNWVLSGVPAAAAGILYRFHYFQAGNGVAAIAAFLFDATITGTAECGISLYAQSDPGRGWSVVSLCGLCAVALAMLVVSRRAAHWATAVHAYNRSAHQGWFKRLTAPRVIWQAKPEHERMVAACAMWFDGYRPYTAAEHGVATVLAIMAGAMVGWARDEVECAVALGLTAGSTAVQLIYTLVRNAHVRPIDTISAVLQLILEELCLGAQIVAVATLDPSAMRTAGVFATIATWLSIAKTVLNCLLLLHAVCCPAVMQFAKGLQPPLLDPDPEAQSQYAPALGQSVCPLSSGRRLVVPPQQLPGRRRSLSVLRLATCPLRQPAQPGAIAHSPPRHRQPHRVPDAADESTG